MCKPYIDEKLSEGCWIREFDPSLNDSDEYVWHRDINDREVELIEGEGWKFQFDNELPKIINKNEVLFVPKMVYHRIIPGKTKLRIKINEDV